MNGKQLTGLFAGALCVITIAAIAIANGAEELRTMRGQIEDLKNQKEQIIDADSIASAIETRISDSLKSEFTRQDLEIQRLRNDLTKTRRQNEELTKKFNSLPVNMPKF